MTYDIPLSEYMRLHRLTQAEMASALNVSQGAVSQYLKPHRDVWIRIHHTGAISSYEKRRIPAGREGKPAR